MSGEIKRPEQFWDLNCAALVMALVQLAALRLVLTDWTRYLTLTQSVAFFAVLLGLALGYSSLYPRTVRGFGLAYGLVVIPAQLLFAVERTDLLYVDLDRIIFRLYDAVALLFKSQPVYDSLFFITLVSIAFWNIGLYAGYQLIRNQNFLAASLPAGILILVVQVYDSWSPARTWLFGIYIFAALLLLGRLNFLQSKNKWKVKQVFFTSDVEGDISRAVLTSAAVVILAAWIFPSVLNSVGPAAKAWSELTKPVHSWLSDAVSALDSPYRESINGDFYGSTLRLGGDAPVGETPVFYVQVDQVTVPPVRYYWRGRVYDQYVNGQWLTSQIQQQVYASSARDLQLRDVLTRSEGKFTVTINFPHQELMYAPSELVWVNRSAQLMTSATAEDAPPEVTAWLASPNLVAGDSYQVRSEIANPSEEELRAAGEEYPQWVQDRYLQVPPALEPQLQELAESTIKSADTPYDKAQAITLFLRKQITYTRKLDDLPPPGQDPLMWVLFQYKKGFCMYSASAEVLMLRSLGIPARMAVGFSEGKFDYLQKRYMVVRIDSHAWPEVYFPKIGWVEFEPTGNQSVLERPHQLQPEEDTKNPKHTPDEPLAGDNQPPIKPGDGNPPNTSGVGRLALQILLPFLYPLFLAALFAFGIFLIQRYSIVDRLPVYLESRYIQNGRKPPGWLTRWAKWAKLIPIQRAFHAIDLSLHWFGSLHPTRATPLERANLLVERLPAAKEEIMALKEEHETSLFTARAGNIERARRAARKILLETMRVRLKKIISMINGETI